MDVSAQPCPFPWVRPVGAFYTNLLPEFQVSRYVLDISSPK